MIYPKDFEQRIGFDKIRDAVSLLCGTEAAQRLVREAAFTSDRTALARTLGETAEMRDVLMLESDYPGSGYTDMNRFLRKIRIEGTYLEPAQMTDLAKALELLAGLTAFSGANARRGTTRIPCSEH